MFLIKRVCSLSWPSKGRQSNNYIRLKTNTASVITLPRGGKKRRRKKRHKPADSNTYKLKHAQFTQKETHTISSFKQELSEYKGKKIASLKDTSLKRDLTGHQSMGVKQYVVKQSLASSFKPCSTEPYSPACLVTASLAANTKHSLQRVKQVQKTSKIMF